MKRMDKMYQMIFAKRVLFQKPKSMQWGIGVEIQQSKSILSFFHSFLQNFLQKSFQFIFLWIYKNKNEEFWVPWVYEKL